VFCFCPLKGAEAVNRLGVEPILCSEVSEVGDAVQGLLELLHGRVPSLDRWVLECPVRGIKGVGLYASGSCVFAYHVLCSLSELLKVGSRGESGRPVVR
jgi:hypothetical protein